MSTVDHAATTWAGPEAQDARDRRSWAALLQVSWWLVRRPPLLVPTGLALLLALATSPVLDDGHALRVLPGIGLLLATAWTAAGDDPVAEVVAASPWSRAHRSLARVAAAGAVVVPAWVLAAVVVDWRAPEVPVLGMSLETLTLGLTGLALGAGLRAWAGLATPAHLAVLGLVAAAIATNVAPRWYALQQSQTWGPPWEATQIRWAGLLLVAAGVVALALRDPLDAGRRRRT